MEQNAKSSSDKKWIIIIVAILAVAAVAIALILVNRSEPETLDIQDGPPILAYAEGVTVVEDPDALQKAVDEMYAKAKEGTMALEYRNDAASEDGQTFECYIANSLSNNYDMYVQIFADDELTDQLLLTGLVRPGNAFDSITLDHPLDPGDHRVYVAFTQVEEDMATLHAQVFVTMDFHVGEVSE